MPCAAPLGVCYAAYERVCAYMMRVHKVSQCIRWCAGASSSPAELPQPLF